MRIIFNHNEMHIRLVPLLLVWVAGCASASRAPTLTSTPPDPPTVGVLVMAHGGSDQWNATIADGIELLRNHFPVALALGMADSATLSAGLDSLAAVGVGRVALVRLFVSGTSFLDRTSRLLGLPPKPAEGGADIDYDRQRSAIPHDLDIATHAAGLAASTQASTVLQDRARELSLDAAHESVLVLAHGQHLDEDNQDLLRQMESAAGPLRRLGFQEVQVATLREDWAGKRTHAEAGIRRFVSTRSGEGDRVLVLPFRLTGFGPYASVLHGLSYAAGRGFLPHPEIAEWIRQTANDVITAQGWQ